MALTRRNSSPRTPAALPGDRARRRFLAQLARTAGGASLFGLGLVLYSRSAQSLPAGFIRPPGALDEETFLSACVRCGLCVRDCPFDTLKLLDIDEHTATGTPVFEARKIPCEMCDDIPCLTACPTGALQPGLENIDDARMGVAVLIDQENCLNFQGLRCDVCYRVCPLIDKAITLEAQHDSRSGHHARFIPTVHAEHCTGCGKCEHRCVLEQSAIRVLPYRLAKGDRGNFYRFGWEEKERRGSSLVTPDAERQYNLPAGSQYNSGGEGLIRQPAVDTLNRKSPVVDLPEADQ